MIADAYWQLIALRAAQGFGAALIIPATVALVNEYAASDADRGGNFGVYNTFRLIGFGFGPVLAGVVVERGPYDLSAIGLPVLDGFDAAFRGRLRRRVSQLRPRLPPRARRRQVERGERRPLDPGPR